MYDRTTSLFAVNEARCKFLPRKQRHCDVVPPTRVFFRSTSKEQRIKEDKFGLSLIYVPIHEHWGWMKEKNLGLLRLPLKLHLPVGNFWNEEAKNPVVLVTVNATVLSFLVRFFIGYCQIIIREQTCLSNKTRHLILTKNVISLVKLMKIIKKNTFSKILPPFWYRK